MKRAKASVVWELVDAEGAQRLVVDVDAPLRPFGADPTPPYGVRAPDPFDEPTVVDEAEAAPAAAPAAPAAAAAPTEALLKALRARTQRP
ncbi:MAG: hypothetical protein IT383_17860 [Deltaproteobacteria bacterium]|nr:hypothetical protein [Deltaproteobacteria bacterium]